MIKKIKDVIQGKAPLAKARSAEWPKVRKNHLQKYPYCSACGGTVKLEVHHIKPFHTNPELELNSDNLITLCESKSFGVVCHLLFGHLGSYKKINPEAKEDVVIWNNKLNGYKK